MCQHLVAGCMVSKTALIGLLLPGAKFETRRRRRVIVQNDEDEPEQASEPEPEQGRRAEPCFNLNYSFRKEYPRPICVFS